MEPIASDDDYEAALVRLERLMDAAPDSAEGDELAQLADLITAYEEKRWPLP